MAKIQTIPARLCQRSRSVQAVAPLHPDLVPYLEVIYGVQWIRHPLYFFPLPDTTGYINRRYEKRKALAAEARRKERWDCYIRFHEGPYRLFAFAKIADRLSSKDYWKLLAEVWNDLSYHWRHRRKLTKLITAEMPFREHLMSAVERRALAKLPDDLTVYRGYDRKCGRNGWSWTLQRDTAERCGRLFTSGRQTPLVATGRCHKSDVIAYFTGRKEAFIKRAVIVINPTHVEVQAVERIAPHMPPVWK